MILLPKFKNMEARGLVRVCGPKVSGHVHMSVMRPDGRVRTSAEFDNLVTDNGLDMIGNQVALWNCMANCVVGTGQAAPTAADVALQAFVASAGRGAFTNPDNVSDGYVALGYTYTFGTGAAAGTLSEIGLSPSSGGSNLFSRAQVLDSSGQPTSITVLSDERLIVQYVVRVYFPLTDAQSTVDITGVGTGITVTARPVDVYGWRVPNIDNAILFGPGLAAVSATALLPATGVSSNGAVIVYDNVMPVIGSYTKGSFTRSATWTYGLTSGITGKDVSLFMVDGSPYYGFANYQFLLGTPINKASNQTLTLSAAVSWGRH